MMAGFVFSPRMILSKWSAICPTVLWANTSGCASASSTVSGSSGRRVGGRGPRFLSAGRRAAHMRSLCMYLSPAKQKIRRPICQGLECRLDWSDIWCYDSG
jgi:hypothetical protein